MSIIRRLHEDKFLRDIDMYFAINISDSFEVPEGGLLFALIFKATESGSTCLDIDRPEIFEFYERYKDETDEALSEKLISGLMKKGVIAEAPGTNAPFIKSGSNIYMKSFYMDEKSVSDFITGRAGQNIITDTEKLNILLDKYFSESSMQKAAAANAAMNSLSVISGGPGTGKTRTVFALLALLNELSEKPLDSAVCAPTGKAASRLTDSLSERRKAFGEPSAGSHIPEKALTIHRLLRMSGDSKQPEFDRDNKLPYDVLIVDEASMVDVRLMARLVDALDDNCRLILMGDKDQLASVAPGAVLGDICTCAPVGLFSAERAEMLSRISGKKLSGSGSRFSDITIMLDKSFRYKDNEGIGLLSKAAGAGDFKTAMDVLTNDKSDVVKFINMSDDFEAILEKEILGHFKSYMDEEDPAKAIKIFNEFRILTPHRKTTGGTDHINSTALKALFKAGLYDNTKHFYHGMPVMIIRNDYGLSLFNGETGLVLGKGDGQKAFFTYDNDETRQITPARLPDHVPAYSMTVHKSQGSEFKHVLFVLPETDSAILTRELFYTAVTRAREKLTVISTPKAVEQCLSRKTERSSGIFIC